MGITAAVRGAIEGLRAAFISGAISEKKFRRREDRLLSAPSGAWAEPVKRPAAPSSGTRQNRRRDLFIEALEMVNRKHAADSRRARRNIARAFARQWFQSERAAVVGA